MKNTRVGKALGPGWIGLTCTVVSCRICRVPEEHSCRWVSNGYTGTHGGVFSRRPCRGESIYTPLLPDGEEVLSRWETPADDPQDVVSSMDEGCITTRLKMQPDCTHMAKYLIESDNNTFVTINANWIERTSMAATFCIS